MRVSLVLFVMLFLGVRLRLLCQGRPDPDADPGLMAQTASGRTPMPAHPFALAVMMAGELMLGLVLGLVIRFLFAAIQTGGTAHRLSDGLCHGQRGRPGFRRVRGGYGSFSIHGQSVDVSIPRRTPFFDRGPLPAPLPHSARRHSDLAASGFARPVPPSAQIFVLAIQSVPRSLRLSCWWIWLWLWFHAHHPR